MAEEDNKFDEEEYDYEYVDEEEEPQAPPAAAGFLFILSLKTFKFIIKNFHKN